MDKISPTFLAPIELPEYCFLSEAIDWIALGQVPQAQYHLESSIDETSDYRFYWREMPDNFEPDQVRVFFDKLEFETFGILVKDEYFGAAEKCFGEYVHSFPDKIAEYGAKKPEFIENSDGDAFDIWQKLSDSYRDKLLDLRPLQKIVDDTEAQFNPYFEIAWAKLFQLLFSGEIIIEAICYADWELLADNDEYEAAASFVKVDGTKFGLSFDWSQNKLQDGETEYVALRVRTVDILRNRSLLLQKGVVTSVIRFGSYYETTDSAAPKSRRKRGRPNSVDWDILKNHLNTLVQESRVPDGKENCIYELIAFAEREFGKTLGRSTVQRHLRAEMDAIFARK